MYLCSRNRGKELQRGLVLDEVLRFEEVIFLQTKDH